MSYAKRFVMIALGAELVASPLAHAGFGFVLANDPAATAFEPYAPPLTLQHNSAGRENTVIRYWAGYYEVRMPRVMQLAREGNVQVSTHRSGSAYCKARLWSRRAELDSSVFVECYGPTGAPADAQFTVLYHDEQIDPTRLSYLWLDRPDPATWGVHGYAGPADRRHNARSPGDPAGDMWVASAGETGRYHVYIHGWPETEAGYLLTATGGSRARCAIESDGHEDAFVTSGRYWIHRHAALVACVNPNGTPAPSSFSIAYANERMLGRSGIGAYLLANRSTSVEEYVALPERSFNAAGGENSVQRTSRGVYTARLGGLAGFYTSSTALVTARGARGNYCSTWSWSASASDVRVSIRCFAPSGAAADSEFFLSFVTNGL
jgi:hypothetical protein